MNQPSDITFIGHAGFLLRMGGIVLVTDPNLDLFMGIMPRLNKHIRVKDLLVDIDVAVISHAHVDHLSLNTLNQLNIPRIILPAGTGDYLRRTFQGEIIEIGCGETVNIGGVAITAAGAIHPTRRYLLGKKTPALSYVFKDHSHCFFFTGDTGYGDHFREIGRRNQVDVALLPIGMATPDPIFGRTHLRPENALDAFLDLKAKTLIPHHFGTFRTYLEHPDWPLKRLKQLIKHRHINNRVTILEPTGKWTSPLQMNDTRESPAC